MQNFHFENLQTILCIGAHADDIEIGCGGTLMKLLAKHPDVTVHWVVLSGSKTRAAEAVASAEQFLTDAQQTQIVTKDFRDSYFPYDGERLKDYFFELQRDVSPDLVFTHRREDLHQDHRLTAELTWNTFRNHTIFEYEIPKYEGDLGHPNVFVPLTEAICRRKIETLITAFASQAEKPWFREDTFWSLLRLRGLEAASPTQLAEGLYCRKLML